MLLGFLGWHPLARQLVPQELLRLARSRAIAPVLTRPQRLVGRHGAMCILPVDGSRDDARPDLPLEKPAGQARGLARHVVLRVAEQDAALVIGVLDYRKGCARSAGERDAADKAMQRLRAVA